MVAIRSNVIEGREAKADSTYSSHPYFINFHLWMMITSAVCLFLPLKTRLIINFQNLSEFNSEVVRPDWASYWTLGNFLKPLATVKLAKSPTFLGNF